MALKTRLRTAGRLLLLATALLATYLVSTAIAARIALRALEVRVPNLQGQALNDATASLMELGLRLRVEEQRRTDTRDAAGHIAVQHPEAGANARRGRNVRVWLSEGARTNIVPRLVGETERMAIAHLEQDGVRLAAMSEVRTDAYPTGMVVAQDPPPDSTGNAVSVLLNRGERGATYLMPDLIGVNGARAADVLRERGFRVAVVGQHPYPGVPPGVVLRQSPEAGFRIGPGEPISIEVSR
ncbi:MAG: PASTA domain-containing protein [Acidobacteria bacterium]|nr:MAG: PASTA domain-containing protein [Acidobacteriota bacterium]RPJ84362.1 MAG: PASTA domain-containing protein [Acidobacteriota bacterium]